MPDYDYQCPKCETPFSEFKTIGEYCKDPTSVCPGCEHKCGSYHRVFDRLKVHLTGTKVTSPEFNPGLGMVVKNKAHKEDICKRKGVVEIGNDFGSAEKQQKHYEKRKKEEIEANWKKDGLDIDK